MNLFYSDRHPAFKQCFTSLVPEMGQVPALLERVYAVTLFTINLAAARQIPVPVGIRGTVTLMSRHRT